MVTKEKTILYNDFQKIGFSYSGISRFTLIITCELCLCYYETLVKGFIRRRYKDPLCPKCYKNNKLYDDEWKEKNRQAQLIAQNRPEVLEKHRQAQKKRYEMGGQELLKHYQEIGKMLWKIPSFREKQHKALLENWKDPEYRKKVFSNYRQYIGDYNGIRYYSLVELSFLLWCDEKMIPVKNYDGEGIKYEFNGKLKTYFPDFIINEKTIIEVKGRGRWYDKHRKQIEAKNIALMNYCQTYKMMSRMVFDTDLGTILWKKAKKLHLEMVDKCQNF